MRSRIKRLDEFELNEGIFQSLFGGIGDLLKSKKSKLSSILKKIKTTKMDEINNRIEIERKIAELPKENTPEYRFDVTNLNRQLRVYSSMKALESNALIKEADEIMKGDPKLVSFFGSELSKIEAEVTERLIKNISPYKEKSYIDQLNAEFDRLVKDANKKEQFYKESEFEETDEEKPVQKISSRATNFIEMNSYDSKQFLKEFDKDVLNSLYSEIKNFLFDLEYNYDNKINVIKEQIKKAKKEGQYFIIPSLEEQESMIKFKYKKPIDSIRYKLSLIDKELKTKKYANY